MLFEKRLETRFDLTVCVACPPEAVESRMQARGYTREQIEQRRERQMPLAEKIQRADHLISNAGSLEFEDETQTAHKPILARVCVAEAGMENISDFPLPALLSLL